MKQRLRPVVIVAAVATIGIAAMVGCQRAADTDSTWSEAELAILQSLTLHKLPPLPPDPSNAVADLPAARAFGEALFFDTRLSANNAISCATCHQSIRHFTDGLPKGQAIGTSQRNTPSILGTAYSPWLYWDGRRDSQWSQALAPLEDPNEQASNRLAILRVIAADSDYRQRYTQLFGPLPALDDRARFPAVGGVAAGAEWRAAWSSMSEADRRAVNRAFANVGKAIAAFERGLHPAAARFDAYVAAVTRGESGSDRLLSEDETAGLRLFIGKARCTQCHNGPLLTNNEFHNTGVLSAPGERPDKGRVAGLRKAVADPFNCLGEFSDDPERQCAELRFVRTGPELTGAVRTPSLRNVEYTAPYMHKGQLATLEEVVAHYNTAPDAMIGHNEAKPLNLSRRESRQLVAFLGTLDGPAEAYSLEDK